MTRHVKSCYMVLPHTSSIFSWIIMTVWRQFSTIVWRVTLVQYNILWATTCGMHHGFIDQTVLDVAMYHTEIDPILHNNDRMLSAGIASLSLPFWVETNPSLHSTPIMKRSNNRDFLLVVAASCHYLQFYHEYRFFMNILNDNHKMHHNISLFSLYGYKKFKPLKLMNTTRWLEEYTEFLLILKLVHTEEKYS